MEFQVELEIVCFECACFDRSSLCYQFHQQVHSSSYFISFHIMTSNESKRNLIIVSNRLPVSIKRVDGTYQSSISSGGLVTSLSGLCKSTEFQWFGWPGLEVKGTKDIADVEVTLSEHHAIPIFLDSGLAHEHYNGFSSMDMPQPHQPY